MTRRVYTTSQKRWLARVIAAHILEDKVSEEEYDDVVENTEIHKRIESMIGMPNPYSLLRQIQSFVGDILPMITDEWIEDTFFLLHFSVTSMREMRSSIVDISRCILREREIQKPFFRLVRTFIDTYFLTKAREEMEEYLYTEYLSPRDERLHARLYAYIAPYTIARAYRSYKLRTRLPVVANKARLKDEIEYRPLTGIKYFEALSFFENKEWLHD